MVPSLQFPEDVFIQKSNGVTPAIGIHGILVKILYVDLPTQEKFIKSKSHCLMDLSKAFGS